MASKRRLTIGRRAVAVSIVAEAIRHAARVTPIGDDIAMYAADLADEIVDIAYDSEYKVRSDQLVLTLDASMEMPDRQDAARSTPEDWETRTNVDPTDPNP